MVDIDSETLFNGAAATVATIAVLFFTLNVEFSYSPVSKFGLILGFLIGIFALTQRTTDAQLTLFGYGIIVVSGVALFFEAINTFESQSIVTVVGLLVIAGLLFAVRTLLDESNRFVSGTQATYAFGAFGTVVVLVLVIDIATGGLAYTLQPATEIEFSGDQRDELVIGEVVVTNPTPFPERVNTPAFEACAAGNWTPYRLDRDADAPKEPVEVHAHVEDDYNEHVLGFNEKTYPIVLHIGGSSLQGSTFPVQVTEECPETETGSPYIALYERQYDRH